MTEYKFNFDKHLEDLSAIEQHSKKSFINSKDSKNKPYYYKTPLFNHTVDHPEIKKLNDANKQKEKAKLVAEFNNMVVEEFLEKHGSKIDIFHSHKIEYSLGGMHSQQESFASVFTHHDPVSKAHNVWTKKAKNMNDTKYPYVVHAEANAILNSTRKLNGARIYVALFPCNECAKLIIQSGIKEIIYLEDKYKNTDSVKASKKMLKMAKIMYNKLENIPKNIERNFKNN